MSNLFFWVLKLLVLFISIHLSPMDNNEKLKEKEDQQSIDILFDSPLYIPCFQQQSISLEDTKQHSLLFNRNEQPCITHYLQNGVSIATLTQINNDIHFENNNSEVNDFSFHIPYQVGALTINTQGQCIFEKKIDVYCAYLTSKTVSFIDTFFSNNGLMIKAENCKTHAQVTCSDILFEGKTFEIFPKSSLYTKNSLTLITQSKLTNEGFINSKNESLISSSFFKNSGVLKSYNLRFKGNKISNPGNVLIKGIFDCTSKIFEHAGMLDVCNDCIIQKGNTFSSSHSSVFNVNGTWKSFITSLYLKGSFNIKNIYLVGKNFTTTSPFHCIADNAYLKMENDINNAGIIKILELLEIDSKNINLEKTSSINTDNADLKANQTIQNEGIVSIKNHLSAHARIISNAGNIQTNSVDIKADRYYYNKIFSTLTAKNNLTIHTPLSMNLWGLTHAQDLTVNSIIGLNTGIYSAKNIGINTFASLNAGLLLPKFNKFAEIYSFRSLWGFGEHLFTQYIPMYGVLKNMQGFYSQGKTFCNEISTLYKRKSIGISDIIALLFLTKNIVTSVRQTSLQAQQSHSLFQYCKTNNYKFFEIFSGLVTNPKYITQQIASTALFYYAPNIITNAIFDRNDGIALGIQNQSTNFYHYNLNTSLYFNSIISTHCSKNTGYLGAYNLNIKATSSYSSESKIEVANGSIETCYMLSLAGSLNARKNLILKAQTTRIPANIETETMVIESSNCSLGGNIQVSNGTFDVSKLHISGPIKAQKDLHVQANYETRIDADITADTLQIQSNGRIRNNAHLTSSNTYLAAESIDQHNGSIEAQQDVVIKGDNIYNSGKVRAPKITVIQTNPNDTGWGARGRTFCNSGELQASEQLIIDSKNIHLSTISHISAPTTYLKSDGVCQNAGEIKGEQLVIDANRPIENNGCINVSHIQTKSMGLHLKESSEITTKKAYFDIYTNRSYFNRGGNYQNDGKINSEHLVIDASKAKNNGNVNASDLQVKSNILDLTKESDINVKNAYFQTNDDWYNNGQLKAEQCFIDNQPAAVNNGNIDISQLFQVNASRLSFEENSHVKTKNASYKANSILFAGSTNIETGSVDARGKIRTIGKLDVSKQLNMKATQITIEKNAQVSAAQAYLKTTQGIDNKGNLSVSQLVSDAKDIKNLGVITADKAHLQASQMINNSGKLSISELQAEAKDIKNLGVITADKAHLKAIHTINNSGNLSAPELFAHGKYIENSGKITTNNAHIKADRLFWNQLFSSIEAENELTTDALMIFNTFGRISANKLDTHAIIDVNLLGLYQGNNISQYSFVGLNAGILLPKFKSVNSLKELITQESIAKLSMTIGMQLATRVIPLYLPKLVPALSLIKFCLNAYDISKQMGLLKKDGKFLLKKKDLCVSDVVPVLCQTKSLLLSTVQPVCQVYGCALDSLNNPIERGIKKISVTSQPSKPESVAKSQISDPESVAESSLWTGLSLGFSQIPTAISFFGPQLSRNSLIDINNGLILGITGNSQSLFNVNHGISGFAHGYSLSTISGKNTGFIGGGNISLDATESYFSNGQLMANNLSMVANNLIISGYTYAFNNMVLTARDNVVLDRTIKGGQVNIHAKNIHIQEDASIASHNKTNIIAQQTLINKGIVNGNQTILQGNEIILDTGSEISAHGNNSNITIKAKKLHLKNDSHISATDNSINAQSIKGDKGNTITSQKGTVIKTNAMDNQGTINGPLTLEYKGKAEDLKHVGNVDQFVYKGTLDNDLADKLAHGNNDLLNVNAAGGVNICADKQNVHLKEQHALTHSLRVETEGTITCDKDLFSEKSVCLQAKDDVHHASVQSKGLTRLIGKNISSEGLVKREYNGENYKDTYEKSTISGNQVIIEAQEKVNYKATHVHSGKEGTQLSCKELISDTNQLTEYNKVTVEEKTWREKSTTQTENLITSHAVGSFTSEGKTCIQAENAAELHGTIFDSKEGTYIQAPIKEIATYDTHTQQTVVEKEVKVLLQLKKEIKQTKSVSSKEKPIVFKDQKSPTIISATPVSLTLQCDPPEITINAPAVEIKAAQKVTKTITCTDSRYTHLWDRRTRNESLDIVTDQVYSGIIHTNAQTVHIEDTNHSAPTIQTNFNDTYIKRSLVEDIHQHQKKSLYNRPTPLAINIIAFSLALATQSWSSSLAAGALAKAKIESAIISTITKQAVSGAFNELCLEGLKTLIDCNGNCRKAVKQFASTKTIRNIAKATVIAATTAGINKAVDSIIPPLSQATTFNQHVLSAAPRELINGGIRCGAQIAQGRNPKKAIKDNLKSAAANTIGTVGSSQIGQAYAENKIDPITHKILHTGLGTIQGSIIDGKKGAISGALGAGIAETFSDLTSSKSPSLDDLKRLETQLGRPLTHDEFAREWNRQTIKYLKKAHSIGDASKIIAATVAAITNQDVNIAYSTATKAIDNNFFAVVDYGIMGIKTAYALYQVPQIYAEKGIGEALKYLGVEIGYNAANLLAGRATAHVVFKFGGILYPSARAAINAALDKTPSIKSFLGNFTESLISAGENFAKTGLGKQIVNIEAKLTNFENKIVDKAIKQVNPSFAEDLVEHI